MGLVTWILLGVIILVAIGLGVGVFFTGLFKGAQIVGQNPTVQNATQEAKDFVSGKINGSSLAVTTDSSSYQVGSPVHITIKNDGAKAVEFPDAALGLQVKNSETGKSYSVMAAQVVTELAPGEDKTVTWQDGEAPAGKYLAVVHTTGGDSAQSSFEVRE